MRILTVASDITQSKGLLISVVLFCLRLFTRPTQSSIPLGSVS